MKCTFVFLALLACCTTLSAQTGVSYPDVATLRTALMRLAAEKPNAFQAIKGTLRYKKGTVAYYNASVHIVKADTPKIAEDTNPLQAYYMNFLAKEMTVDQSKEVFAKWQDLIMAALPGYTKQLDGKQYPDLESVAFTSPDGRTKFTLYRNGSGAACQVSVSIINSNLNELIAAVVDKPAPATTAVAGNNPISKEEFGKKLKQLIVYAKTGFAAIKGDNIAGGTFPSNKTDFWLPGAIKVTIMNVGIGTDYEAYYARDAGKAQADALFEQLRGLLKAGLPAGFVEEQVVQKQFSEKSVAFVNKVEKLDAEIRMTKYSGREEYNIRLYISQRIF